MKLYHGTTDQAIDKIKAHGLYDWEYRQPAWLTASRGEAAFFASLRVNASNAFRQAFPEVLGGNAVVVEVDVPESAVVIVEPLGAFAKAVIAPEHIKGISSVQGEIRASVRRWSLFYPGWMGVMETAKFIQRADDEHIQRFKRLLDEGKADQAWSLVEAFLGLPHHALNDDPVPARAALVTVYAAVDRFADPVTNGIGEGEALTDTLGTAAGHRGYQIAALRVPASMLEELPDNDNLHVAFFAPKAHISPLFVRAVYNPWIRRQFKVTGHSLAFALEDLLPVVKDRTELAALKLLVQANGEVAPRQQREFMRRATPYLVELFKKSGLRYPMDHLFGLIRKGAMVQDGFGNYALVKHSTEVGKTLTLTVGDIVKDINTATEGEVIAISKIHHEADIDIVVRWEKPINGQSIFEVHPNEIEFVRHKTEAEVLKDVDYRYYDESKALKSRLDYGITRKAENYSPVIVKENFVESTGLYEAAGTLQWADETMWWGLNNDTDDGEFQFVDPQEIADEATNEFREYIGAYMNPPEVEEQVAHASGEIWQVVQPRYEALKEQAHGKRIQQAPQEPGKPTKKETKPESKKPDLPPGAPSEENRDRNGFLLVGDEKTGTCRQFDEAYSVWSPPRNEWRVIVNFDPKDATDMDILSLDDYLKRRSLCQSE